MATLTTTNTIASPKSARRDPVAELRDPCDDEHREHADRAATLPATIPGRPAHVEEVDDDFQERRGEQDLDDRLVELFEELLPNRFARKWREAIGPEAERLSVTSVSVESAFARLRGTVRKRRTEERMRQLVEFGGCCISRFRRGDLETQ